MRLQYLLLVHLFLIALSVSVMYSLYLPITPFQYDPLYGKDLVDYFQSPCNIYIYSLQWSLTHF